MWPEQNKDGHEERNLVVEYYLLLNFVNISLRWKQYKTLIFLFIFEKCNMYL